LFVGGRLATNEGSPIGIRLNDSNIFSCSARRETTLNHSAWGGSQPAGTVTDNCAHARGDGGLGYWESAACVASVDPIYTWINCESELWDVSGTLTFIRPASAYQYRDTVVNPVSTLLCTAPLVDYNFGATINIPTAECRHTEQFILANNHDDVSVANEFACALQLGGSAQYGEYNPVLSGVTLLYMSINRPNVRFGLIYWASEFMCDMAYSAETATAFAIYRSQSRVDISNTYTYSYGQVCNRQSMTQSEINNEMEQDEMYRLDSKRDAFIGLRKTSGVYR
jgi:hypothetical protein